MDDLTSEELLKEVKKAIHAVMVGGQSYKIGTRELTRANLKELRNLKATLEEEIRQSNSDLLDNTYVAVFDGR